jgi:large subunit ribosomal protein L25
VADQQLAVEIREATGKGVARKLRAAGRVPAVFYGRGDARSISLDPRALDRLLAASAAGMNTLIDLTGGTELAGTQVLVKELQRDPVRGEILHADLYAVDLTRVVQVSVPLHLEGIPQGVSLADGILDHQLREIEIECLPTAIPEEISVDVSALDLGDSLHVRDVRLPDGVSLLSDGDISVASVVAPAAAEEEVVAPEEGEEGVVAEGAPAAEGEGAAPTAAEEKSEE